MSKKTYSQKLQDPRWQRKRLEVMRLNDFSCQRCGNKEETLHIHHGYYDKRKEPWDYEIDTLWCFCKKCHEYAERSRLNLYEDLAVYTPDCYWTIAQILFPLFGEDHHNQNEAEIINREVSK